jgi:hypothetical protein
LARGFKGDVIEFFLGNFQIPVSVDLIPLDDIRGLDFLAGVGVDLQIFDPVSGLLVDLVETDLVGLRRGREKRDRTGNQRKAQKAFPIGTRGHLKLLHSTEYASIQ